MNNNLENFILNVARVELTTQQKEILEVFRELSKPQDALDALPLDPRVKEFARATGAKFITMEEAASLLPDLKTMLIMSASKGVYHALSDVIVINPNAHAKQLKYGHMSTLEESVLHELVHWSGHTSRMNRRSITMSVELEKAAQAGMPLDLTNFEKIRNEEEVTAQMGMHGLAYFLGLDMAIYDVLTAQYINQFRGQDLNIERADDDARKAVRYFFETLGLERFANREYDLKG